MKIQPTSWRATRIIALMMFVVFSTVTHHAAYAAHPDSHVPTTHVDALVAGACAAEQCGSHHEGQLNCCALGFCGALLPGSNGAALPLASTAYPHDPFLAAPRSNVRRVERPPKAA